ncbi:MAG: hypothetical protein R3345_15445, partial [Fulvivirga sp.]|nr:hypothetical protein [Fulvivirga sp.]
MKKLALMIITLAWSTWSFAQSCPVPEPLDKSEALGTWDGAYSSEGKFLAFTLKISQEKGELKASLDIPEVGAKHVHYSINICDSEELHIKNVTINSTIEFIGRPENG